MRDTPEVMCGSSLSTVTNAVGNWAAEVAAVFLEAATSHVVQTDALTIGRSDYE